MGTEPPRRRQTETLSAERRALLHQLLRPGAAPGAAPITRASRERPLPASFAQERVWFLDQFDGGTPQYHVPVAVRLTGPIDFRALEDAFTEIVRRHESLRTTFAVRDGTPVQVIGPPWTVAVPLLDLEGEVDPEAAARRLIAADVVRPFDLARGPLLRTLLLRLREREHVLLFDLHHTVYDAWSIGVLLRELGALYGAFREGRPSPLPELPVQYADYAAQQRESLHESRLQGQLAYWRHQLAGAPQLLELPADRPRPAVLSHRGATHLFEIDLLEPLEALCRREGATLFMALLAGFAALLHRYTGQTDVVVGTSVANRARPELAGLIGLLINTLALRLDLSGRPTFRQLLARARQTALDAFANQDLPFEQLVWQLRPERNLDRTPLFQVALELHDEPAGAPAMAGLEVAGFILETSATNFDLHLRVQKTGGLLRSRIEYRSDLFDAATVERLAGHYRRLLEAAAAEPGRPVGLLPLLGPDERRLLDGWSSPREAHPPGGLPELVEAQARRTPAAVALVGDREELTYADVDRLASRIARRLRRMGVGPESRVGLLLDRSPALVPAMLGILRAGAAYVPLDPEQPAPRLAAMVDDARIEALVTAEALLGLLPGGSERPALCLDRDREALEREAHGGTSCADRPESLCYVVYTSGSTGRPKGVAMPHRAVSNFVEAAHRELALTAGDVVLALATPAFDIAVLELLVPLTAGAAVVVAPRTAAADGRELQAQLEHHGVTVAQATPATWRLLLEAGWPGSPLLRAVSTGEALPEDLARALVQRTAAVWNLYGPSETFYTTMARLRPGDPAVSIGRPVPNCRVHVLGPELEPAPPGVPGELYVGGEHVARGYLGRPDLTAERFLPDPFGPPGGRLYRTGDMGRWRPDGELSYLGRGDRQVKIRGHRVEPGEVEVVLRAHPAISDAAVVAAEVRSGEVGLIAYVVGAAAGPPELRAWLLERLPEHLVPAAVVHLEELPLTANGKVDRGRLPAPAAPEAPGHAAAPRTALEEQLCGIWAAVLGRPVGVEDDFFEMGGHSLLAAQAVARAREALGVELSLRAVFEAPTVARLAARLEQEPRRGPGPPLRPVPRTAELPLSFAQQRLWFLDLLEPGLPLYNLPAAYRLRGRLRPEALRTALDRLVARHEVLRSRFENAAGRPRLAVLPELRMELPVEDVAAAPDPEAAAWELAGDEARRPFDLSRGPLLRARLLRLGVDDHVLLLTAHHIVSDGISQRVIERELSRHYAAGLDGSAPPLPDLPLQYADFAAWQRERLRGHLLAAELAHSEHLRGLPPLRLPADRPGPAVWRHSGAICSFELPAELAGRLRAVARELEATLYLVLLAAFAVLLRRWTGQVDLAIGTPSDGRGRVDLEPLVGLFVGTLVLRLDLSGDPPFPELVGRAREVVLDAHAHQEVPFERLVEALQPERHLGRNPLFQVWFVLQDPGEGELQLPGVDIERSWVHSGTAKFDLTLSVRERERGLTGAFEYSTEVFEAATVERMAGHLSRLLQGLAAGPGRRLSELPLLGDDERALLVEDWSATAQGAPPGLLHQLFAARVTRVPDRVALAHAGVELTYRELDARANRLARRLRRLGVGPETPVGLLLGRSVELVVALLAVLKAGGAFVPLDPAHPAERLRFALRDAGVRLLVTSTALSGRHGDVPLTVLDVDRVDLSGEPDGVPEVAVTPENLAYVIYTSGSTGLPKGVAVPHRGLPNLVLAQAAAFGVEPGSTVLQFASPAVDAFVAEVAVALGSGARLALADAGGDPAEAVRSAGATVVTLPPALLRALPDGALEGVETLVSAGEPCAADLIQRWAPGRRFVDAYGPTEATVCATLRRCRAGEEAAIGRPLPGVRAYVLDEAMRPVPQGALGQLYLGGVGVARGYAGRPGQTAQGFLPDPFANEPGARLYRTGDLARWRADGELEHRGRADGQLKVRGFLVEPAEVEAALRGHPRVAAAAVAGRGDRLVGYVVGEADPAELREHLGTRLPAFMVPAAWVRLDRLPLTASGKVDRRALPEPGAPEWGDGGPPATPAEAALARIWADVLGIERVGPDDNYFALGGDSILSIQVVARAREAGLELSPRQLFERQTVRALAAAAGRAPALRAERHPPEGEVTLTPIQRWFLDGDPEEPWHFNQALWLEVPGDLGVEGLERALGAVAGRHDALRLRFERRHRGWRQWYAPPSGRAWELREVDLQGVRPARREEALASVAEAEQAGLSLAGGPLLRGAIVELGPGGRRLLLVLHHLVVDTVSWGVLVQDLEQACSQVLAGRKVELAPPRSSFQVWSRRLGELAASEALRSEAGYWLELVRRPVDRLPVDGAGENLVAGEAEVEAELGRARTGELLHEALGAYRAEMPEVLLAAVGWALGRWSGGREWLVAVEGHGREDVGVDVTGTVGWLASRYPLAVAARADVVEALREAKERVRAVPGRGLGYGLLRYLAGDGALAERLAVEPEVGFNYLGQLDRVLPGGDALRLVSGPTGRLRSLRARRPHLLEVLALVREGRLRLRIGYGRELHRRERAEELAEACRAALEELVAGRRLRGREAWVPSDFPAAGIGPADLRRVLDRHG